MAYYPYLPLKEASSIQLHYWLSNNVHVMDALIQNKSELDLIRLMSEVGNIFDIEIIIETEALAKGGIRRWFKVVRKNENKQASITIGTLSAIIIALTVTPITSSISKITEILIENFFEDDADIKVKELDNEGKELKNEEQRIKNEILKQELYNNAHKIESNLKIKKYRSNFYEELEKEKRVERISFVAENEFKLPVTKEYFVTKENFKEYILATDEIDTETVEDAIIEIISPVLKKGDYKWRGIYDGNTISFNMKSNEFKTLVQTGKIEFKNGSAINCILDIKKGLNANGDEKVIEYNIVSVNHYFENNKPIETPEGKKKRQIKEAGESQFNLFD